MEEYIEGWLDGNNPPQIPDSLIPEGITDAHSFKLIHPDSADAGDIWAYRYSKPINLDSIYPSLPDPNVTYLLMGPALAPFGSKVHIEGEFPHCRFFSIQMSPPLSGKEYNYDRAFGPAEVSIADVDIDPLPGHVNPFRIGSNRNAAQRSYNVTFNLKIGDPVALSNGNFAPPYRYPGNERNGALLQYQGPWGVNGGFGGITPGDGEWNIGNLWVRIYAPDSTDPLGGVSSPRVYYELPDGRKYFITANFDPLIEQANTTVPAQESYTSTNENIDIDNGWLKSYGVLMNILCGVAQSNGWMHPDTMAKIREVDLGATGRSQFADPPRDYEAHATVNNYTSYLGRLVRVDTGYVAVLTGKLPTFPDTRAGLNTMQNAQCRYFSICGYDNDPFYAPGSAVNAVMDDQILLDEHRNYMICYSRPEDVPDNATNSNNVTWVNWGPTMDLGLIIRMVTLGSQWNFAYSPTSPKLPWSTCNLASPTFDSTLVYQNWHKGFMKCYLPRVHLMKKEDFEDLGNNFDVDDIPITVHNKSEIGLSDALNLPISSSSVKDNSAQYDPNNANDIDFDSYWSSQTLTTPEQTEWLTLDMGSVQKISAIKISWVFSAHASEYEILISSDSSIWNNCYQNINGNGGNDIIDGLQITGRYIKLKMNRCVLYNYGVHNFEVYSPSSDCLNGAIGGISDKQKEGNHLQIYPNPTTGIVNVSSDEIQWKEIFIYQADGTLVKHMKYKDSFEIPKYQGVFYIVFKNNKKTTLKKVLKL